jgi:hypothetical protein
LRPLAFVPGGISLQFTIHQLPVGKPRYRYNGRLAFVLPDSTDPMNLIHHVHEWISINCHCFVPKKHEQTCLQYTVLTLLIGTTYEILVFKDYPTHSSSRETHGRGIKSNQGSKPKGHRISHCQYNYQDTVIDIVTLFFLHSSHHHQFTIKIINIS